jgi:hypothetical protein
VTLEVCVHQVNSPLALVSSHGLSLIDKEVLVKDAGFESLDPDCGRRISSNTIPNFLRKVALSCRKVALSCGKVALSCRKVALSCRKVGLSCGKVNRCCYF